MNKEEKESGLPQESIREEEKEKNTLVEDTAAEKESAVSDSEESLDTGERTSVVDEGGSPGSVDNKKTKQKGIQQSGAENPEESEQGPEEKKEEERKLDNETGDHPADEIEDERSDTIKESDDSDQPVKSDTETSLDEVESPRSGKSTDDTHADDQVEDYPEEEDEKEGKDYSHLDKEHLVEELALILDNDDIPKIEKQVRELKPFYEEAREADKKAALDKYLKEGGDEGSFEFSNDVLDNRFEALYEKYRTRRNSYYSDLELQKDLNLQKKHEILEKLRQLIESEETTASISDLKKLQQEWRTIGPVPNQYVKSLWASYNILIDRYYDNRSIYFELKELDRKKNLNAKIDLCQKAEALIEYDNINAAIKELNDLHEEFKHIGPVPKDQQEEIWLRFKAASDAIYSRRKDQMIDLKKELHDNYEEKKKLVEEIQQFKDFDSDKITEWNEKTHEILDLQKRWENIGGLPREHSKEINRRFWSGFKEFFNNKNRFFKQLEGKRDENLKLKEDLVLRAQELKDSEDWVKTAKELKELQVEWKNIGPVPEKNRNEVFRKFKEACDKFFSRRREMHKQVEEEYKENLTKKEEICERIEKMVETDSFDIGEFEKLQSEFEKTGFVPRNAIKKIQKKYNTAVEKFLKEADLTDEKKNELKFSAEVNRLKSAPNSERRIQRKENEIRRQISKIENDIAVWKNNLEFFASSRTADKVREEFNRKIKKASNELEELKDELRVLNKI